MKSVLISIQPKWCELITSGNKTVEVRKTKPKMETPFRVYIYETQNRRKVIGYFVCDKIYDISPRYNAETSSIQYACGWELGKASPCLSFVEMAGYLQGKQGYGWHITDLVIFEKPKELSEFSKCGYDHIVPLKTPPQSWMFVEEINAEK